MTKRFFFFLLALAVLASCEKPVKNAFTISGTVDTMLNAMIYLQKRVESPLITIDSTQIVDGKFNFKGNIDYPEVYYLTLPATKSSVPFFIEASEITVNVNTKDINKSKISGSKNQSAYDKYLDFLDKYNVRIRESYQMYNTAQELGDEAKISYYDSVINAVDEQRSAYSKKFALDNDTLFISPYIVYRNSYSYEMDELEAVLQAFDPSLTHSVYTKFLEDFLATLKRTSVGQPFVPFSMADSSGVEVSLTGLTGSNYLLVDFWASWCAPCREENPNLVALYNEYHEKGFDIFGVSFDSRRERWLKAIADDQLTWTHVSDLKGWENAAGKLYGIRSIPSNVLLDPNGVIIAKNLRGEDLRDKLKEIFDMSAAQD